MLNKIKIEIDITCPNCGTEAKHFHDFELKSTIERYKNGELTAIGHTKRLYENSMNFNCPKCNCWHCAEMDPIEVHVHPEVTTKGFVETANYVDDVDDDIDDDIEEISLPENVTNPLDDLPY